MQSVKWYTRRLSSMSPGEIAWRCRGKVRDFTDRFMIPLRSRWGWPRRVFAAPKAEPEASSSVLGGHLRLGDLRFTHAEADRWKAALVAQADRILAHRLDLFDLRDHYLGETINWNYEYKAGKNTPMHVAAVIDYRDYASTGDCKFAWEPNRHHQLVVLGRAYRVTGDERYANGVIEQLDSWASQCPYGYGMNWRSPLELGIRLINWVWAVELIRPSPLMTRAQRDRLARLVYQHIFEITRRYSRFSSANNHLVGEAAGVFTAASYFPDLRNATQWRRQSRDILAGEILLQTHPDGGTREQATGYHVFTLQLFLLTGLLARNVREDLPPSYWSRLERMFEFVGGLGEASGTLPMIGDCDDAYVLDLGGRSQPVSTLMSIGAVLFNRSDFKALAGGFAEAAFWMLGPAGRARFEKIGLLEASDRLDSRAFPDSGYFLLQHGRRDAPDQFSVLFDCGDLGFLSIAAHGHADALSIVLRVGGIDVLIDPGTYDYFTFPQWREYFRSTRAHNTIVVDDMDQSQMLGSFLWGRRAHCRLIQWEPTQGGGAVCGEHDGYTGLADPVTHRRTLILQDDGSRLSVRDDLFARGTHSVTMYWHFGECCTVTPQSKNCFRADFPGGRVTIILDPALSVSLVQGSEDPILGWVSCGYRHKAPSPTLVCRCALDGNLSLVTQIARGVCAASETASERPSLRLG